MKKITTVKEKMNMKSKYDLKNRVMNIKSDNE